MKTLSNLPQATKQDGVFLSCLPQAGWGSLGNPLMTHLLWASGGWQVGFLFAKHRPETHFQPLHKIIFAVQ